MDPADTTPRRPPRTPTGEAGTSPVTAVFGLAVFLAFVLFASQVLLHLFTTSVVTSVAFDTAGRLAVEGRDCGPQGAAAEALVLDRLGSFGETGEVRVDCEDDGERTLVTVRVRSPARALSTPAFGLALTEIERTAVVRSEQARP